MSAPRRPRSIVAVVPVPVRVPVELVERVDALSEALDETRAQTIRRVLSWLPPVEERAA